jgi:hypothetical protein
MSIETGIVALLETLVAGDDPDWEDVQICDTLHVEIVADKAVRVGNMDAEFAPNEGQTEAIFYNAEIPLEFLCRITGPDKRERGEARDLAARLARKFALAIYNGPTISGAVFDAEPTSISNTFAAYKTKPFAVSVVTLLCNQTGETL